MRAILAVLSVFLFSIPAWGKTRVSYQIPCDDLWSAVKETLGNHSNYGIIYMDDYGQRASFAVVGTLVMYTQRVALEKSADGCTLIGTFLQVGADDSEWRQFHKRLGRSLSSLQASKPKTAAGPPAE